MNTEGKIRTALKRDKQSILERLSKNTKIDNSGCHLWTAGKNDRGYGQIGITYFPYRTVTVFVHRLVYLMHNPTSFNDNLLVMHKCDTRLCLNPEHLIQGTEQDNTTDMLNKGRVRINCPIITTEKAEKIRQLYITGEYTLRKLGRIFNTDLSNIALIVKNKTWKTK